jgi:MGT family glycosyltransferase
LLTHFDAAGINWQLDGPPALLSPHLHVTYWSPRWFSGLPLLPQNQTVGGNAPDPQPWNSPWLNQLPMDQPWIFITLGTSFSHDANFFIAATHAAVAVGGLPILAIGDQLTPSKMEELQTQLPKGTIVTARVEFGEVLPYAAAAIHHGGAGTTHALVTHAVPQIVVPHAADQSRQAEGVARSGVGYRIPPKQVTIPLLVRALQAMLPNNSAIRQNARALQAEFAALGGVPKAADLLAEVIRE